MVVTTVKTYQNATVIFSNEDVNDMIKVSKL